MMSMMRQRRPEQEYYVQVEQHLNECINRGDPFLFDPIQFDVHLRQIQEERTFPYKSLVSLIRNLHLRHVKRTTHKVKAASKLQFLLQEYTTQQKSILQLAREINYPPYLLSRIIVEALLPELNKSQLTQAMRQPTSLLTNTTQHTAPNTNTSSTEKDDPKDMVSSKLAHHIQEALAADPMYGPRHDKQRHMVGIEYEVVLEHQLTNMGLAFETEEELRNQGTSKTPDILLSTPIAIPVSTQQQQPTHKLNTGENHDSQSSKPPPEWKVICWIDSKALFGDVYTHNTSVMPQAESYVHRFGPGMILYWFGHAPTELLAGDKDICIADELPKSFMLPDGTMVGKGYHDESKPTKVANSEAKKSEQR